MPPEDTTWVQWNCPGTICKVSCSAHCTWTQGKGTFCRVLLGLWAGDCLDAGAGFRLGWLWWWLSTEKALRKVRCSCLWPIWFTDLNYLLMLLCFVHCFSQSHAATLETRQWKEDGETRTLRENKTFLSLPPCFPKERQNNEIPSVLCTTLVCSSVYMWCGLGTFAQFQFKNSISPEFRSFSSFWVPVHFGRLVLSDVFNIIYNHQFIWIFLPLLQSNLVIYFSLQSNLDFSGFKNPLVSSHILVFWCCSAILCL